MNRIHVTAIGLAVAAILSNAAVAADEPNSAASSSTENPPRRLQRPTPPEHASSVIPIAEPNGVTNANGGFGVTSPFAAMPAATGTTLTGPVTLTYSGSSNAFTITNSGSNNGISAVNSSASNNSSALYGEAYGAGAGLTGYNAGTRGPGGKFAIVNAQSDEPAAFATTNGYGPAILGTITNKNSGSPAIQGQNTVATDGIGVEGDGSFIGLWGTSSDGTGVYGQTHTYVGVYGQADAEAGTGVYGFNSPGVGVYGESVTNTGVYGTSRDAVGVYGKSTNSWAGFFEGSVAATSFVATSDRHAKRHFKPIDNHAVLEKVSQLSITAWDFKSDQKQRRHIGPMAQDFHAAFHLNGDDDKHINVEDLAGVSLAAIQELHKQLNDERADKDVQIAALKLQLQQQSELVSKMQTIIETFAQQTASGQMVAQNQ
jgi:hypothetical protein